MLGNQTKQWFSFDKFYDEYNPYKQYGVRYYELGQKGHYNLNLMDVMQLFDPELNYIQEMADNKYCIFNGELYQNVLYYNSDPGITMKEAMARGFKATRFVDSFFDRICDSVGRNQIHFLDEAYPDHVMEISIFDRKINESNTIVWEVRRY